MADSQQASSQHVKPMKVGSTEFLGVLWGGLAIALVCCAFRFLARLRSFKKLLMDDYFVLLAIIFATANAILWQIQASKMYTTMKVSAGLEMPGPDFPEISGSYFKATLAVIILYYSSLWSIKIAFLVLFKRLGRNVKYQNRVWWPVFLFTLATYFVCIGDIQYNCLVRPFEYLAVNCITTEATQFQQVTLKMNCAWDVITDFLITLLPITMLWGVKMNWHRKAALFGIFSLVMITIVFSIVRTAVVGSGNTELPDSSWLYMWSSIEASVAIIVACLASFRNLFSRETSRYQRERFLSPNSNNLFLRGSKPRSRLRGLIDTLASMPEPQEQTRQDSGYDDMQSSLERLGSTEEIKLGSAVHVRNDYAVVRDPRVREDLS